MTLVGSLIPLAVLYMIWLPATALGWIKDDVEELAFKEEYSETMMEESGMGRGGGGGGDSYFFSSVSNSLAASEASAKANSAVAVDVAAVALMEEARAEAPAEGASSKKRSRIKRPAVPPVEEAPVSPTELEISWIGEWSPSGRCVSSPLVWIPSLNCVLNILATQFGNLFADLVSVTDVNRSELFEPL